MSEETVNGMDPELAHQSLERKVGWIGERVEEIKQSLEGSLVVLVAELKDMNRLVVQRLETGLADINRTVRHLVDDVDELKRYRRDSEQRLAALEARKPKPRKRR